MIVGAVAWSAEELDLIVEDYFAMLRDEKAGIAYSKADHRRALMKRIGRSNGSIEFKHCNVTAVLREIGEIGISGYKPRQNYQGAILGAIERHLDLRGAAQLAEVPHLGGMQPIRLVGAPPPPPATAGRSKDLDRIVRRFDPLERDMLNRSLGLAGERMVVDYERARLVSLGRGDLAARVRHVSVEDGDGLGYDIESYDPDGTVLPIEVKTTRGTNLTPFFMSRNELDVADRMADRYRLYRLHEFGPRPALFVLRPPIGASVRLTPESWRAELR